MSANKPDSGLRAGPDRLQSGDIVWLAASLCALAFLVFVNGLSNFLSAASIVALLPLVLPSLLPLAFALWIGIDTLIGAIGFKTPVWARPRAFCAENASHAFMTLKPRLDLRESDGPVQLWRDRVSGQLWASRYFDHGFGAFCVFKPLPDLSCWLGADDADWRVQI